MRWHREASKVSIIVPMLNEEHYLPMLLTSLENQSCKDFELVLIDGKSTDSTLEIVERFKKHQTLQITVIIDPARNIGYIRNRGAQHASGSILLHTCADVYIPQHLIRNIRQEFYYNKRLVCLTGRTFPLECGVISHFAYGCFDLLRWLFVRFKYPIRKISPSGNFMTVKANVFNAIGGFPEVKINEDGELGRKITEYCASTNTTAKFNLKLWIGHYADRFNQGSLQTLRFYSYVFGNFSTTLKKMFTSIEMQSAEKFAAR